MIATIEIMRYLNLEKFAVDCTEFEFPSPDYKNEHEALLTNSSHGIMFHFHNLTTKLKLQIQIKTKYTDFNSSWNLEML